MWTRWIGVPFQACNKCFFSLASARICRFIRMDIVTKNRLCLKNAKILLSVPFINDVNCSFMVRIDGNIFKIKVVEEFQNYWGSEGRVVGDFSDWSLSWESGSNSMDPNEPDDDSIHGGSLFSDEEDKMVGPHRSNASAFSEERANDISLENCYQVLRETNRHANIRAVNSNGKAAHQPFKSCNDSRLEIREIEKHSMR